jgi:hypothetical protein
MARPIESSTSCGRESDVTDANDREYGTVGVTVIRVNAFETGMMFPFVYILGPP